MSDEAPTLAEMEGRWEAFQIEANATGRHDPYLLQPYPTPLDEALDAVVSGFGSMSDAERAVWKGKVPFTQRDSQVLLTYGARMATQALREGSTDRVTNGLLAHLIEGERDDWRENIIVLTLLFDAMKKLGAEPLPLFDAVASLALGDPAGETLKGFRNRKPEVLTIESMGYRTTMANQGVRYEPDPAIWKG
ncbi:MAG TPA: hypothetical protein VG015_00050 [Candidatus Dormibacteraeota bacterium]|jgi:hypothetical protein|nr:hypothetical protein [Candidatus Dormibacteraeota bacterium]